MINYFTATTDSPANKACFCGRQAEIENILKWISAGKNVAVIGETRIGKTFLRYILRDICTGTSAEYVSKMLDAKLSEFIKDCSKNLSKMKVVDLSLHTIRDGENFYLSLADELLSEPVTSEKIPVRAIKQIISKEVMPKIKAENSRLVLLLDEFDVVREYNNLMEVLGFLKDLSEEEEFFSLVVFGWPGVLDRIRAKYSGVESTLVDCIEKKIYLQPLDLNKTKVLVEPLSSHCTGIDCAKLTTCIFNLTGGRPYFTQYICDYLVQDDRLKTFREKGSDVCVEEMTDYLNRNSSIRDIIKSIWNAGFERESELLAYIAHHPGTTLDNLTSFYEKYQHFEIRDHIDRLSKYGLIVIRENKASVNGLVIERWGQIRKENPVKTYSRQKAESEYADKGSFAFATDWNPPQNEKEFDAIICKLVEEYQHNVEHKKGAKLLWLASEPAPEEHAQILFDVITDQYAQLADIDINREIETGRGPVDFKFSRGRVFQAHLEVKRATSNKLEHGLRKQLPTYLKADKVRNGYYLVMCYDESDFKKTDNLIQEATIIAKELGITLRVMPVKAYQKIASASKVS